MRTTIDFPDDLFRQAKATAALQGRSLKDLVTEALRAELARVAAQPSEPRGWRRAFGEANPADVAKTQAIIDDEFSNVDLDAWT